MGEFDQKQQRIQALLAERQLDALLLRRVGSFAWATCGAASYVNTATTDGAASLLMTPSGHYVITNNIEATRIEQEEKPAAQGWELRVAPWHAVNNAIAELTRGLKLGADGVYPGAVDLSVQLAHLRANLTPKEGERFRVLGRICADAINAAIRAVRPGQTEYEIAARLGEETKNAARRRSSTSSRPTNAFSNSAIRCPPIGNSNATRCSCCAGANGAWSVP